jgi:phage gpG-like protein
MPTANFAVDFDILPPVYVIQAALSETAQSLRSFREPLQRAVRSVIAPRIYENFDDGGASGSWAPLALSTIVWKFNNGFARNALDPLKRSGKLQKKAAQLNNWKYTSDTATFDKLPADAMYGMYHQFGYTNALTGGNVPARPWVEVNDNDIDRIEEMFDTFAKVKLGIL